MKKSLLKMLFGPALLTLCTVLATSNASAEVHYRGAWPEEERVSLSLREIERTEAIRRLSDKAGWNVIGVELGREVVSAEVEDVSTKAFLERLLRPGDFEVEREGKLVTIRRLSEKPKVSQPQLGNVVHLAGEDVVVAGDVTIAESESVGDVIVWRGDVVVHGEVRGSVVVFGGTALLKGSARVGEDLIAFGGELAIENGASVSGDVAPVFGSLRRGESVQVRCTTCNEPRPLTLESYGRDTLHRIIGIAVLWLVGSVALALGFRRVEVLRRAVAAHPLKCLGLGLLASVFGLAITGALFITLIGIPVAILLWIVVGSSVYWSATVTLLALGERVMMKRSENPYVHLGVGCAGLALVSLIPYLSGLLYFTLALVALGGLIATRGAGLIGFRARR